MANYQMKQHRNWIESQETELQEMFKTLVKLSKGFTEDNTIAKELDNTLFEFMQIDPLPNTKTKATPQAEKRTPPLTASTDELTKRFNELFDSLKKGSNSSSHLFSEKQLTQAIQVALEQVKIKYNDLDTDLQHLLSTKERLIRYELPEKTLPQFNRPSIASFQQIVDDMMLGNNVLLIGGAGTGKTFLAENLLTKMALGRKHLTINCSQWTSPTEIIGGQTMDGYVEGKLIEAWKHGYVLILDELPKIDPNTAGLFNDALAKTKMDKAIIFNGRKESFEKHPDFACIATGNIYPDKESMSYGANNKQDLSLLDRFSGSVYFIEKNESIEREVIGNDMIWSLCNQLRSSIETLKYEAQLSLRFMQNARDSYLLEMKRFKSGKKDGLQPNEGKTLKVAFDNFLSTFTEVQIKNLKEKIGYSTHLKDYQYRQYPTQQLLF